MCYNDNSYDPEQQIICQGSRHNIWFEQIPGYINNVSQGERIISGPFYYHISNACKIYVLHP